MLHGVSFEGMESRRSFAEGKDLESKKGGLKKQNNIVYCCATQCW